MCIVAISLSLSFVIVFLDFRLPFLLFAFVLLDEQFPPFVSPLSGLLHKLIIVYENIAPLHI